MAFLTNFFEPFFVMVIFLCFVTFTCSKSDYYDQDVGDQYQVIYRALVCFNNNFKTNDNCNGPCLAETKLQGLGYWNHASSRVSSLNYPMYLLMYVVILGFVYL
ncbi:hypothetical protein MKX01_028862 [Papaver californicum]|nr:hypothetical protein MKX01_028862 [Papaver californicum]